MATSHLRVLSQAAQISCFDPVEQTPVALLATSNDGWNSLATNFITGLTGGLSEKLILDIGNIFFNNADNIPQVAGELLNSQAGFIVLFSIGVIFSLLLFIGAIVSCVWACTCRRSGKGIASPCLNITGIVLAFVSFGFVVAGIVLYALSVDAAMAGILDAPRPLNAILNNVDYFGKNVTRQLSCAVHQGFDDVTKSITNMPDEIIDQFEKDPSLNSLIYGDYSGMGKAFADSTTSVDDIVKLLTGASTSTTITGEGKTQVADALEYYTLFQEQLGNLPQTFVTVGEQVAGFTNDMESTVKKQAQPVVATATGEIQKVIDSVTSTVSGVNDAIDTVVTQVRGVLQTITDFENQLNEHDDVTGWIAAGAKVVIIVPCVVVLFAAFVAFIAGIFLASQRKSLPSRGCCSASCTLITLSIIVMAISFVVMLPATLGMTVGYGTQLVCKPFFDDPKLTALSTVDTLLPTLSVPAMTGPAVELKFSAIMLACEGDATFMKAVQGDKIIDLNVIETALQVDQLKDQLSKAIATAPIQGVNPNDFTPLKTLGDLNLVPDLGVAEQQDPTVPEITNLMKLLSASLAPTLASCKDIAKSADDLGAPKLKEMLTTTSMGFIDDLATQLNTTAVAFMTDLLVRSAPCTPVYRAYEDVGGVACTQMMAGLQGMWAAAGLAALFFLPAVIAVFCVASALRGGKSQSEQALHSAAAWSGQPQHDEDPFKLPPISTSPASSPTTAAHSGDTLPRLMIDTGVVAGAAVAAAPAAHPDQFNHPDPIGASAPLDSVSEDPWQSSYVYPTTHSAAAPPPFVDPLVYPTGAAAPVVGVYPRVNASTSDRYYDNSSYAPSTLTRF